MMLTPEGPSALPLWINGHAFLTMVTQFHNVTNPTTGIALRCVPLCGADEVSTAIEASQAIETDWAAQSPAERQAIVRQLGEQLNHYAPHFAKIIIEETGFTQTEADHELFCAVAACQETRFDDSATPPGIVAILTDGENPLAAPLGKITQALVNGHCVLIKTSVKSPSALYAVAELTARVGLPGGVLNLIHGEEEAVKALAATPHIQHYCFTGHAELGEKIDAILAPHQKHRSQK